MKISVVILYCLDNDDQANVTRHLQTCGDCRLTKAFFKNNRPDDPIVKADDLCLEMRADLERDGRDPEKGVEICFDQEGEAERHLHTLRLAAELSSWSLQEIQEKRSAKALPNRCLVIPTDDFLIHAFEHFLVGSQG